MSGRARTGVELDVVWRAAEDQLGATAEGDQVGRGHRQPAAGLEHTCQLAEYGLRIEDVLDDLSGDDGGEALRGERQRGFDLPADWREPAGLGRAQRGMRHVQADDKFAVALVDYTRGELPVIAAEIEDSSARPPRQKLPQPRGPREVEA